MYNTNNCIADNRNLIWKFLPQLENIYFELDFIYIYSKSFQAYATALWQSGNKKFPKQRNSICWKVYFNDIIWSCIDSVRVFVCVWCRRGACCDWSWSPIVVWFLVVPVNAAAVVPLSWLDWYLSFWIWFIFGLARMSILVGLHNNKQFLFDLLI